MNRATAFIKKLAHYKRTDELTDGEASERLVLEGENPADILDDLISEAREIFGVAEEEL